MFLSDVLTDMLAINPNNRKSSSEIYEMLYKYENEILDLEPFAPPERYIITQEPQIVRNSNFFPPNQYQNHPINGSSTFASNIYTQPMVNQTMIPVVQMNDSRLQRSGMPVHQVISNGHLPQTT